MKFKLKHLLIAGLVLILLVGISISFVVPMFLRGYAIRYIQHNCDKCKIEIGSIYFSPLQFKRLKFADIRFEYFDKDILEIQAEAGSLQAALKSFDWNQRFFIVDWVKIHNASVTLTETPKKAPQKTRGTKNDANAYAFAIHKIELRNANFTYNYRKKPKTATLGLSKINVDVDAFGTTPSLQNEKTTASAHAQLERSGKVNLTVSTYLFKSPLYVDVNVKIDNQNLNDVTPFFQHYDGVILNGRLVEGISSVSVRDQNIRSTVLAEYKDLDVKIEDTSERSEASAFFTQLFTSIAMKERNIEKPKIRQIRSVEIERKPDESLVSFILRGMKDAAIAVAKAK